MSTISLPSASTSNNAAQFPSNSMLSSVAMPVAGAVGMVIAT